MFRNLFACDRIDDLGFFHTSDKIWTCGGFVIRNFILIISNFKLTIW